MSRRETVAKHDEWAVRRPDGSLYLLSARGGQGNYDAHAEAERMNAQAAGLHIADYKAAPVRREVTTTVVTTTTATPWVKS